MAGLVRNSAKKSMGRAKLTFPELTELMLDVEFALNNRPLTYQGDELEMEPLTPNHFIHERRLKPFDTGAIMRDEETTQLKKCLRYLNQMKEHYWKRWQSECLQSLREHNRIVGEAADIKEGDVVPIKSENQPRNTWKLGKIIKAIKGSDGITRGVRLQTMTKGMTTYIERPLQHIYPMELKAELPEVTRDQSVTSNEEPRADRPRSEKGTGNEEGKGRDSDTIVF